MQHSLTIFYQLFLEKDLWQKSQRRQYSAILVHSSSSTDTSGGCSACAFKTFFFIERSIKPYTTIRVISMAASIG